MRVVDLFCGAGGFSEGFRQAGFELICGIDNWQPAVDTYSENYSNCTAILAGMDEISRLPDEEFDRIIPDAEVIIGSPPCIAFSNSNKSGRGVKAKGIELVESFLRIVARKKTKADSILKYWILENVPKAEPYIKKHYSAKKLGINGDFILNTKNESSGTYQAECFGVPSKRKRYFCGEFPAPMKAAPGNHYAPPLREILQCLGPPCDNLESDIRDPSYPLKVKSKDVTDHHYVQEIAEFQWRKLKRLKEDKGYMGWMYFPENESRLCRAVMATMTSSARESMVFRHENGRYRAPTIRELASLMSFPIDYRFYGSSKATKHQLVGNAVPPKLAYAFALAILEREKLVPPKKFKPIKRQKDVDFYNLNFHNFKVQEEKPKRATAKFKYHIPYLKVKTYRVELTNYHSDFKAKRFRWNVEIHKSQGPLAKVYTPSTKDLLLDERYVYAVETLLQETRNHLVDFEYFQRLHCMTNQSRNDQLGPFELLEKVKDLIMILQKRYGLQGTIPLRDKPYELPEPIGIGYFALCRILDYMEGVSNEQ